MKEEKYTLEEIKKMIEENNFFAYNTPLGDQADEHAADYNYDEGGTLDVEEAVRDAFVYGVHWVIDHLKGSNIPFKFLYMNQDLC